MKYPELSRTRSYRVGVPQLNGGINYSAPANRIEDNQLSDALNVWYKNGMLQTRPGIRKTDMVEQQTTFPYPDKIKELPDVGVAYANGVISEQSFISVTTIDRDGKFGEVHECSFKDSNTSVNAMVTSANVLQDEKQYDLLFFIGGSDNTQTEGKKGLHDGVYGLDSEQGLKKLEPYIPTIMMNGKPVLDPDGDANSDTLEPKNLLTKKVKCSFTSNGEGEQYILPFNFDSATAVVTFIDKDGREHTLRDSTVDTTTATVGDVEISLLCLSHSFCFAVNGEAYALPSSGIKNNVVITCEKMGEEADDKIVNMRFSTWFGGNADGTRLFVSGNPKYQNLVHWSALNNPLYFPENNYAYVGEESRKVTAFGKQNDMLVVFKERELYFSQYIQGGSVNAEDIQNQTVVDIEAQAAKFPFIQIHAELGCDCPETIRLCNNRLVWLNSDGKVYGLFTAGQYNDRNVRELSGTIENALKRYSEEELKSAGSAVLENYYLLQIKNDIYVMDYSSSGFSYYTSYRSDDTAQKKVAWYRWRFSVSAQETADTTMARLFSVCGKAFVFFNGTYGTPICMEFKDSVKDEVYVKNQETFTLSNIPTMLKTKLFDFGTGSRFKRVNPVFVTLSGEDGASLRLCLFNGLKTWELPYKPILTGEPLEEVKPLRMLLNAVRVKNFGLQLECDGQMQVADITIEYRLMGSV